MVVNIAYEILQTVFLLQRKWLSNLNALLSSNTQSRGTSRICEIFFQNSVSDILSTPTHLMIALKNGNLRSIFVLILWQFSVYQNPVKLFIFSDVYQILICKQHCRIVISFILGHRVSVLKYHSNKLILTGYQVYIFYISFPRPIPFCPGFSLIPHINRSIFRQIKIVISKALVEIPVILNGDWLTSKSYT